MTKEEVQVSSKPKSTNLQELPKVNVVQNSMPAG